MIFIDNMYGMISSLSLATIVAVGTAPDDTEDNHKGERIDKHVPSHALEPTGVRVCLFVEQCSFTCQSVACVNYQGHWDNQQNEGAADAARVGHDQLRLSRRERDDNRWDAHDGSPHALHYSSLILNKAKWLDFKNSYLEEESRAATVTGPEPSLDG